MRVSGSEPDPGPWIWSWSIVGHGVKRNHCRQAPAGASLQWEQPEHDDFKRIDLVTGSRVGHASVPLVEFTPYFLRAVRPKRPYLKDEWLALALRVPDWVERQPADGRVRYWVYIPELRRYLRVVTLEDGRTIRNAFPDRSFRRPTQ